MRVFLLLWDLNPLAERGSKLSVNVNLKMSYRRVIYFTEKVFEARYSKLVCIRMPADDPRVSQYMKNYYNKGFWFEIPVQPTIEQEKQMLRGLYRWERYSEIVVKDPPAQLH